MQCKNCLSSRGASHVSPLEDEQENQLFICAELAILSTSTVRVDLDTCTGCWAGAEFPVDVKRSRSVHVMQSAHSLKLSVYCTCRLTAIGCKMGRTLQHSFSRHWDFVSLHFSCVKGYTVLCRTVYHTLRKYFGGNRPLFQP